jgi:hypothetical protein
MNKLEVAEQYSWYILEALMQRIATVKKVIEEGEQVLEKERETTPKIMIKSLENTIAHCKQIVIENEQALKTLKEAGFK